VARVSRGSYFLFLPRAPPLIKARQILLLGTMSTDFPDIFLIFLLFRLLPPPRCQTGLWREQRTRGGCLFPSQLLFPSTRFGERGHTSLWIGSPPIKRNFFTHFCGPFFVCLGSNVPFSASIGFSLPFDYFGCQRAVAACSLCSSLWRGRAFPQFHELGSAEALVEVPGSLTPSALAGQGFGYFPFMARYPNTAHWFPTFFSPLHAVFCLCWGPR